MPRYIEKAMHRFCVPIPPDPQHQIAPEYGKKVQINKPPEFPPSLSCNDKHRIQEVVGVKLYHARAVNPCVSCLKYHWHGIDHSYGIHRKDCGLIS